jgi:hypothetical protein
MKKTLTLLFTLLVLVSLTYAQKSKTPPPPAPRPVPKGPPPYVLKKDYEPKIAEMDAKINAASGAANAARRNAEQETGRLTRLDSQMNEVQNILNSANFQIAMNADSLAVTRSSIDELTQKTDNHFNEIQASQASFSQTVWVVFGALLAVSVAIFVILMSIINKKMAQLNSILHKNEEILKKSLLTSQDKLQKEVKEELQSMESRSLSELSSLKRSITQQVEQEKATTTSTLQTLAAKVESLEIAKSQKNSDTDPEVFI